jgi:superfamily II DNA/RNA helicase
VPSRELALQVNEVAKKLAHHAKFSTSVVVSGERKSVQRKNLSRRLDIVVGTPGRIVKCIKEQDFFISSVTKLVVDEADTLFDAKMGFRSELDAIILPLKASAEKRNVQLQFVLVAATIKSPLDQILRKKIGGLEFLCDENIHKIPSTITEEFIRVPVKSKHPALREALLTLGKDSKSIVFCRNTASCQSTEHMLREYEFNSVLLHGSMHQSSRKHSIEEFVSGKADILVCTDLAARGLHFEGVEHVVMFDFPATAVDYVHRAGRTGRAGQKGKVISFVTKYDVELARIIEEAKRRREAIKGFIPTAQDLSETTTLITKTVKERLHLRKGTKKLKKHKLR